MNAIMLSIKPEWFEKILNGEKTIEIRKTMPKCELPVKVYIYCTKDRNKCLWKSAECNEYLEYFSLEHWNDNDKCLNGKVVAEFTLNEVEEYGYVYSPAMFKKGYYTDSGKKLDYSKCCLKLQDIEKYADDGQMLPRPIYAWHIDNLKIYDKPKELGEFRTPKNPHRIGHSHSWILEGYEKITRPPQNYMFVEEMEEK